MSKLTIALSTIGIIALSGCQREVPPAPVVTTPSPTVVVTTPTPETVIKTVEVPVAGPKGEPGEAGEKGDTGNSETTVVVVPKE